MTLKTLKTFLEVRRPKSADERKFMDKHIVVKHADRNGNGDDLFNAKNIKTIKREKEGHGYDTGKDAKVYEAKLDEVRIKLTPGWGDGGRSMRANKAKLAGKNLPNDPDTGTPDHFSAARRRKRGLDESTVLEYLEEMGIEVTEAEFNELVDGLQEELLGELSNQTLGSYIRKAGSSALGTDISARHNMKMANNANKTNNKRGDRSKYLDRAAHYATKTVKRTNNIIKAAKKIKESNEELDELFSLTVEDLSDKNQALLSSLYESLDLENQINLVETLQEENGLDAVLDFALESNLNEETPAEKEARYERARKTAAARDSYSASWKTSFDKSGRKYAQPVKEENLDESCIAGTKKISSHEGKDGHTHEIRYDKDNEEYSVHHYKGGKHLGEGPVSYHSDKQEAKDQVAYDVKNFKR